MRIMLGRILILSLSFFISLNLAFADEGEMEGQFVYTQTNLWYENPMKILALFHKGTMLPVGTKVKITDIGGSAIEFTREDGMEFRVYTKYYKMDGDEFAKLLFNTNNPMTNGGKFQKFSKMEREQIKLGQIKKGMSRDAVIMSYCYPPRHKNPDINASTWQLWKNRWDRLVVTFANNKISYIQD